MHKIRLATHREVGGLHGPNPFNNKMIYLKESDSE